MQGTDEGLFDYDLTSGKVFYSAEWKAMLGYAPEEFGDTPDLAWAWFTRTTCRAWKKRCGCIWTVPWLDIPPSSVCAARMAIGAGSSLTDRESGMRDSRRGRHPHRDHCPASGRGADGA